MILIVFKKLYKTQSLPHILFVAHPRVSKELRLSLQKYLIKLNKKRNIGFVKDVFIKAIDSDYDGVRRFIDKE